MREITKTLPTDLDAKVAAEFVFDETYWKKRCEAWLLQGPCHIYEHGMTWKQYYFEKYVQKGLESCQTEEKTSTLAILPVISTCQDYIFTLKAQQLPTHPDIKSICNKLPNLTKLSITYGINKIGMQYDRMLFGMKISDADCIAKCAQACRNLTTLVLQSNLVDDDLLRMLMSGLTKSAQITDLDLSHNKITNHGIRLLTKLIGASSILTNLNLADNQIHAEVTSQHEGILGLVLQGGRYLGRALRVNDSLLSVNVRLNRLIDDGGRALLEGLHGNRALTNINLSANSLGSMAASSLVTVLAHPLSSLCSLDISCNNLIDRDFELIAQALINNTVLSSIVP